VLYAGEKWIYRKCDALIFTFENGYDYIRERRWTQAVPREKVFYVNNGVDLEAFNDNKDAYMIQDEDLEDDDKINIIYTGSIRKVNNLGRLLEIAKLIKNDKVRFLVWGDGDELEPLRKRIADEKIDNVVFKGRVDKKYIPYITSKAYINFAHNNPSKLFKFGISFNKIFDYMAAGKPILVDFECNSNPVLNIGAAISTQGYTCEDIARAIDKAAEMSGEQYRALCENATRGAKKYDYKQLAKELISVINKTKTGNDR
jgi:glycosyltransferase involved in cell wall biosynthesis